jgi:hypothetical protein
MKNIYCLFIIIILFFLYPIEKTRAFDAGMTASLSTNELKLEDVKDKRLLKLKGFLAENNSPLYSKSPYLIKIADKFGLDWKLVTAIAGLESSYCMHIPSNSYNCWGWGIPTGMQSGINFKNFEDAINIVSEGLRKNYIDHGLLSLEEIGSVYAASPTWAYRVKNIMNNIENFSIKSNTDLAFTL